MGNTIKAVILAGGKGERLAPLTHTIPKPMVLINKRPLLEYLLLHLKNYSITDITISLCYLPEKIIEYFGNGKKLGINITYSFENPNFPLGTAGAIRQLSAKIKNTFCVIYGDSLRELNVDHLISHHKKKKGIATICVYNNHNPDPKSVITINSKHKVISFVERPKEKLMPPIWSNSGFYVFEPTIFKYIPKNIRSDFGRDIFPVLSEAKENIFAYKDSKYFLDVGNLEKVKRAEQDIKTPALTL